MYVNNYIILMYSKCKRLCCKNYLAFYECLIKLQEIDVNTSSQVRKFNKFN